MAKQRGYTFGYSDGTFRPDETISFIEAVVYIIRLMGYTDTMKLVNVKASEEYIGKIVNVKITSVKTWSLDGEVVDNEDQKL